MNAYTTVNILDMINVIGEDSVNLILSDFSCPLNLDIEFFLAKKAISFARQGSAQTHLVFALYEE